MKTRRGLLLAIGTLFVSTAYGICIPNTRGISCPKPSDCTSMQVWNSYTQGCAPKTCPQGYIANPLNGGGVLCVAINLNPQQCVPGYVWRPDLGRCDYPQTQQENGVQCRLTITWVGLNPQNMQVEELTSDSSCQNDADLATATATVKLLGGK